MKKVFAWLVVLVFFVGSGMIVVFINTPQLITSTLLSLSIGLLIVGTILIGIMFLVAWALTVILN